MNDSIAPLNFLPFGVGWKSYYVNNEGTATITVTKLADPTSATP